MTETDLPTMEQIEAELHATETAPQRFQDQLAEYVALEHDRRALEAKLEANAKRAAALQELLLPQFAELGLQNARVGGLTVYVAIDRFVSRAKDVTSDDVCAVLRSCGCGYMVTDGYNAASLKSKVKEWQDQAREAAANSCGPEISPPDRQEIINKIVEGAVPLELAKLLNIGSVPRLRTQK